MMELYAALRWWIYPSGGCFTWSVRVRKAESWNKRSYLGRATGQATSVDASLSPLDAEGSERIIPKGFPPLNGRDLDAKATEQGLRMVRRLDVPLDKPLIPQGFKIRHLSGRDEIEAYVALVNSAIPRGDIR